VRPARVVHHVPGRLRIKLTGVPVEAGYLADVQRVLGTLPGVSSVHVNPASASIVVSYAPGDAVFGERLAQSPDVASWLSLESEDATLAEIDAALTAGVHYLEHHSRLAESIVSTAEQMDFSLRRASDGYLDLKVLLPLGMAVVTSLHKSRSRGTPMWLSASTFAFNAFLTLHRHRISAPIIDFAPVRRRRA
jgi:copper chaperone CopZ